MAGKVRFDQRNTERGPEWDVWCDDMYLGLICETPEGWTTSIPGIRNLFPTAEVAMAWVKSHWHRED